MFFALQVFSEDADPTIVARDQRGMGIQPHGATEHRRRVIDEEIGEVRAAATEAHAHGRASTRQHGHLGAGGHLPGIHLHQATVLIKPRQRVVAQVEGLEQVLPRHANLHRAEFLVHAGGHLLVRSAPLQQVAAYVTVGHHAEQAHVISDHEGYLQSASLDAFDGVEDALPFADAEGLHEQAHDQDSIRKSLA